MKFIKFLLVFVLVLSFAYNGDVVNAQQVESCENIDDNEVEYRYAYITRYFNINCFTDDPYGNFVSVGSAGYVYFNFTIGGYYTYNVSTEEFDDFQLESFTYNVTNGQGIPVSIQVSSATPYVSGNDVYLTLRLRVSISTQSAYKNYNIRLGRTN